MRTKLKLNGQRGGDTEEKLDADHADHTGQGTSSTPVGFISSAMDIEESQRAILADSSKDLTLLQASKLRERRNNLARKIQKFSSQERALFPALGDQLTCIDKDALENVALTLPSSVPAAVRDRCYPLDVVAAEAELRYAEATEALDKLRHHLRVSTFVNRYKTKNVKGQVPNTRTREVMHQIDIKIWASYRHYRHARERHLNLVGEGDWMEILRPLEKSNVKGLSDRTLREQEKSDDHGPDISILVPGHGGRRSKGLEKGESEGRRSLSWIWYGTGLSSAGTGMHAAVKSKWAKARARVARWKEQVRLSRLEMLLITRTFECREREWRQRAEREIASPCTSSPRSSAGLVAYAKEQGAIIRCLSESFEKQWVKLVPLAAAVVDSTMNVRLEETISSAVSSALPPSRNIDAEYLEDVDLDDVPLDDDSDEDA
ncbi:hypothetical protein DENSPDRAFT_886353 [Dentipellis sp. KUC8613]|nr:hypothetical protein DENSPDRAFT_886353 [Dentipellis sp. KUC8613]